MKLIFTTYTGVYVLDTETRLINCIHKDHGMYYGLTWLGNKLYVAARNSVSDYRLGNEKILIFNRNLKQIGELPQTFKNCGLHSILTSPDNKLWITASLKNKIICVDLITNSVYNIYPNPKAIDVDHNHFNALTWDNDKILINVHNHSRGSEIWICNPDPFDVIKKIAMPGSTHSHCCWKDNDSYWTCASEESQIKNHHGDSLLPKKLVGYTRGLVLTKNRLIVGESERAVREKRATSGGLIHIYERGTMRHITTYRWPNIGQIAEIRALDAYDEHHWPDPFLDI